MKSNSKRAVQKNAKISNRQSGIEYVTVEPLAQLFVKLIEESKAQKHQGGKGFNSKEFRAFMGCSYESAYNLKKGLSTQGSSTSSRASPTSKAASTIPTSAACWKRPSPPY